MRGAAREYYEEYWREPEHYSDPLTAKRLEVFRSVSSPGATVLDAGCGQGITTVALAGMGFQVVGVDVSFGAVRQAYEAGAQRVAQCALDSGLPFRNGAFEAIYCSEVLEHLVAPWVAVREFHRVVRPGGRLLVSVPYHGLFKNLAVAALGFERHFAPDGEHIRFFTARSLRLMLERNGFLVRRFVGVGRCWPFYKSLVAVAERASP